MSINRNTITWLLLVSITILTSFFFNSKFSISIILFLAFIKIYLVAFQFMGLRNAHSIWKKAFLGLITIIFLAIYLL
jgi:heme/copper-type cytochrome/quinol oxidase subunit 4